MYISEVRSRKNKRSTDLISNALPFGLAILPPFTEHFALLNHEKTYLAVAAFDNPRGDACDRGNEVADPRTVRASRSRADTQPTLNPVFLRSLATTSQSLI
jgi:hypothetical protein